MKTFTVEDLMKHEPCVAYTPERIAELFAGRERINMLDVLDMDIPEEDIVWVFTRDGLAATERQQRQFALMCAVSVLDIFEAVRPGDNRVRGCLETVERYLRGEATNEELSAIAAVSWAAWDAAWDAARAAAWEAAWEAALPPAWEAAWELQLMFIHEIITEEETQ